MTPAAMSSAPCTPTERETTESALMAPDHFSDIVPKPKSSTNTRRNFPCQRKIWAFENSTLTGGTCAMDRARGLISTCL